jgi:hypothetical protein
MFGPALDKTDHPELRKAAQDAFAVLDSETGRAGGGHTQAIGAWAFVHGLAHLILDKQIRRNDPAIAELLGARQPFTRA